MNYFFVNYFNFLTYKIAKIEDDKNLLWVRETQFSKTYLDIYNKRFILVPKFKDKRLLSALSLVKKIKRKKISIRNPYLFTKPRIYILNKELLFNYKKFYYFDLKNAYLNVAKLLNLIDKDEYKRIKKLGKPFINYCLGMIFKDKMLFFDKLNRKTIEIYNTKPYFSLLQNTTIEILETYFKDISALIYVDSILVPTAFRKEFKEQYKKLRKTLKLRLVRKESSKSLYKIEINNTFLTLIDIKLCKKKVFYPVKLL